MSYGVCETYDGVGNFVVTHREVTTLQVASLALPPATSSVSQARRYVRSTLADWGLEALEETATLLVSELATNAVLHARTDLLVHLEVQQRLLRVTVADDSELVPRRRYHGLQAGTGRGLALLDTLALACGTEIPYLGHAKGVWFELPVDGPVIASTDEGAMYGNDWLAIISEL